MGVVDQVGQSVETVTDALKNAPLCLAAILLSAMFAVLSYYNYTGERAQSHEREMALIRECLAPGRAETRDNPQSQSTGPRFGGPR